MSLPWGCLPFGQGLASRNSSWLFPDPTHPLASQPLQIGNGKKRLFWNCPPSPSVFAGHPKLCWAEHVPMGLALPLQPLCGCWDHAAQMRKWEITCSARAAPTLPLVTGWGARMAEEGMGLPQGS